MYMYNDKFTCRLNDNTINADKITHKARPVELTRNVKYTKSNASPFVPEKHI